MPVPGTTLLPSTSLLPGVPTVPTTQIQITRPPLELAVEIIGADGSQTRWDAGKPADSIPQGITFRTRRGEGFADGGLTLPRRIDRDYTDQNLFDGVVISGADGSVAYEGRVMGLPRSLSQTHSVTIQTAGWMTHTRDRKMSEVYVDRDMSRWGDPSVTRRAALLATPRVPGNATFSPDATNGVASLIQGITGPWGQNFQDERYYDAGPGNLLSTVYFEFVANPNVNPADTDWDWRVGIATDDTAGTVSDTASLRAASGSGYHGSSTPGRFARLLLGYGTTSTSALEFSVNWSKLAVYGNHGLTPQGGLPGGIFASDAIRHLIGKYCPLLSTSGVQNTTYPIPHLVFRERVDPYDALMEINKYHLWQLGVYDNRTLHYGPVDMSDYDWEVRLSDVGVTVDLQGDSTEDLANGIVVTYTDLAKNATHILTPADQPTLQDTNPDNPVNQHGLTRWTEITLSTPTTQEAALQVGRAALAEFNQAKGAGTISVQGYIRDRQGHHHPCWRVRAGDRIAVTDHPNDRPRLVVETDYAHDNKTIQIAVDSSFKRLDAVLDRLSGAVAAQNLNG